MLWSSDVVEHEQLHWLRHGCSGSRMRSRTNVVMPWAWMPWSQDACEPHNGLGMDALVIGCSYFGLDRVLWSWDAVRHVHYDGFILSGLVIGCA